MKFSHENLKIWQLGMNLVELVYSFKDRFLAEDRFGLWDQLVRSVEAVPRDIAEGYGKSSRKERALYMERAKSETAEADTSFKQAVKKGRIKKAEYENAIEPLIKELYFKIIGYRRWLLKDSTKPAKSAGDSPLQPSPPNRRAIPHFNQAQRSTTGFTLVEMLVVVGLLILVGGMAVGLFFQTLKGASKTEILKEVKQNGNYAMEVMERMIRNAQEIQTCSPAAINIKNPDGGVTEFQCVQEGVAKIASSSGRLTGANVTLDSGGGASCPGTLTFSCDQTATPPRVTISFTLYQKGSPTRPEEKAQVSFKTTVSLRTY